MEIKRIKLEFHDTEIDSDVEFDGEVEVLAEGRIRSGMTLGGIIMLNVYTSKNEKILVRLSLKEAHEAGEFAHESINWPEARSELHQEQEAIRLRSMKRVG